MKLLMLIHRLPFPADRGAKLRAALELRWLAQRHDVWCAGLWEREDARSRAGQASLAELRTGAGRCREVLAVPLNRAQAGFRAAGSLLNGRSASEGYFAARALRRRVRAWSDAITFDAVLAFSSSMAPLALQVPARRRVIDMVDLDSTKWAEFAQNPHNPDLQSQISNLRSEAGGRAPADHTRVGIRRSLLHRLYRLEANRLDRGEREWIAAFDATVLVNEREAGQVPAPLRDRVHVIETGHLTEAGSLSAPRQLPEEAVVGFVGAMDYGPNVDAACWFARAMWPRIREHRRDASWYIVGRSPARAVQQLAREPGVQVTGTVPAVEPWFDRMRVHVAPLRIARGVQTKVVAAMAAGRPCVVTPCVAEGIGAAAGRDYLVADAPPAFARAVLELLEDRQRAQQVADSGRAFVRQRFDVETGLKRLETLLLASQPHSEQAA